MKKLLSIFFVLATLVGCAACSQQLPAVEAEKAESASAEYLTILANGKTSVIPMEESHVSVAGVLRACGISPSRNDDGTSVFSLHEKDYVIEPSAMTLCELGDTINYITPPPGEEDCVYYHTEDDVFVDATTMQSILFLLDVDATVKESR